MQFSRKNSILASCARIRDHILITPCLVSTPLSATLRKISGIKDVKVMMKCENLQTTGSFKYRGVMNKLLQLSKHDLSKGVVTYSTGNHALALTRGVSQLSRIHGVPIPLRIFVPLDSSEDKVSVITSESHSAHTILTKECNLYACQQRAMEHHNRSGMILVPPSSDIDIMMGQATTMVEFERQVNAHGLSGLDAVIVPCGGGSLLAGCATWLEGKPTGVWGAEPFHGGPSLYQSLAAGTLVEDDVSTALVTVADGQRTKLGAKNWEILREPGLISGSLPVTEEAILDALAWYDQEFNRAIEPSAVVGIAASASLVQNATFVKEHEDTGLVLGIILTGSNISSGRFQQLIHEQKNRKTL